MCACGSLAAWLSNEEDLINPSPIASSRALRWLRLEGIAPNPALDWRIRVVAGEFDPIMDRAFIARLWTSLRSALLEFKISRRQRRSDYSSFRDVEAVNRKCDCRRYVSFGSRPRLSTRSYQLTDSIRQRVAAAVSCSSPTTGSNACRDLISRGETSRSEIELEIGEAESTPLFMKRKRSRWEIEFEGFSPRPNRHRTSAKSMEEFESIRWDPNFLTHSASTRAPHEIGQTTSASTSYIDRRRWHNRVNHSSPQVVQPVRGKLATLASLLRTMSDRYARRTGRLRGTKTPLRDRFKEKRPVLTQSQSVSALSTPRGTGDDVPTKRYENPFRDFLRQSFAERHPAFVDESDNDRQR